MDLTRRNALQAGGLAVIAARRPVTRSGPVYLGCNHNEWDHFKHAVPLARRQRIYWNGVNEFPGSWPTGAAGSLGVLSIRPWPRDLFSGSLDRRLIDMARGAPSGSYVTCWHEAGPANPRHYPRCIDAWSVRTMQLYLRALLGGTNVRVGSIICGPARQLEDWIAPELAWYGVDIDGDWFLKGGTFETARFETRQLENLAVWRRKAGTTWPRVVVAETNCGPHVGSAKRAEWFTMVASFLHSHGGGDMCTFWAEKGRARQGTATVPWPPSPHVIATLRHLSEVYRAR